jgi:putative lipoic acid-binding regulatory protein
MDSGERERGYQFPLEVELIAFGPAGEAFTRDIEAHLVAGGAVRTASPVRVKPSRAGRYQAVHLPVWVTSRVELEHLYEVLSQHPDLKFRL